MIPGDTVFSLDIGKGHLWIVVSSETATGMIAVANLTTHGLERHACDDGCVIIDPGDHPFVKHRSCIRYDRAHLRPHDLLTRSVRDQTFPVDEPVSDELLARIQAALLASPRTPHYVKDAITETR